MRLFSGWSHKNANLGAPLDDPGLSTSNCKYYLLDKHGIPPCNPFTNWY